MIQIAINGSRNDQIVPKTTEAILESATLAVENGASSIHFHPRDEKGNETLRGRFVDEQIRELRTKLRPIPIGISTGEWIEPDLEKRLEQIRSWKILPDFVSINYNESGFEQVTELISERGIIIEVGLSTLKAAKNFTERRLRGDFLRILIEPQEQVLTLALETARSIESLINNSGIDLPFLLHGTDETCWGLLRIALEKNYQTRIGFEDTLVLPTGEKAGTNAELVEQAHRIQASCQLDR